MFRTHYNSAIYDHRSVIHSLTHSLTHLLIYTLTHSFIYSKFIHSKFIHSFIQNSKFIHSFKIPSLRLLNTQRQIRHLINPHAFIP